MMVFCTVFDSGYLDKGIVMYESLRDNCEDDFRLYVIAFDDICYKTLSDIEDIRLIPIYYKEFETSKCLEIKNNRSHREYIWTCSSLSVQYVLDEFEEDSCTYIDADLFFYSSPKPLFDEIDMFKADAGIMEHGYINDPENRRYIEYSGKYCVEFNYFRNNPNGRKILNWWCDSCIECCQELSDGIHFGDQKYIEQFEVLFDKVHVFTNKGAGLAPWNLAKYRLEGTTKDIILKENSKYRDNDSRRNDEDSCFKPIFYHFQQMTYIDKSMVDIHAYMYPRKIEIELRNTFYIDYLKRIARKRKELAEEGIIDLWAKQQFTNKEQFGEFFMLLVKYERNPYIAVRRLFRWLFRRSLDYITILE